MKLTLIIEANRISDLASAIGEAIFEIGAYRRNFTAEWFSYQGPADLPYETHCTMSLEGLEQNASTTTNTANWDA